MENIRKNNMTLSLNNSQMTQNSNLNLNQKAKSSLNSNSKNKLDTMRKNTIKNIEQLGDLDLLSEVEEEQSPVNHE